jgi:hypothetical protein
MTDPSSRQRGRPHVNRTVTFQSWTNIWLWAPDGARHQDRQTDWLSVEMWLWLWRKQQPIVFHILNHVKMRNLSEPIEKFTYWDRFQSLACELISPQIELNSGAEAAKETRDFTASIASAYRLLTSTITLSDINNDLSGWLSLLCLFSHNKNSVFRWKGKCLRQENANTGATRS